MLLDAVLAMMALHGDDATPIPGPFQGGVNDVVGRNDGGVGGTGVESSTSRDGAAGDDDDDEDALGFGGGGGVGGGGRGGAMCSALARAGLLPRLVTTFAALNTAANEEAGIGPGGPMGTPSPVPGGAGAGVSRPIDRPTAAAGPIVCSRPTFHGALSHIVHAQLKNSTYFSPRFEP